MIQDIANSRPLSATDEPSQPNYGWMGSIESLLAVFTFN
jgi:hypothetical protein